MLTSVFKKEVPLGIGIIKNSAPYCIFQTPAIDIKDNLLF